MLNAQLEAVLFASGKPVSLKALAKLVGGSTEEVTVALEELTREKNVDTSGIHVLEHEGMIQLVSNPAFADAVGQLVKDEFTGELTRPQLETLSIICYRGPVTKPEIEQIRGVNCSLIIRNLLIRGLIEEREDTARLQPVYTSTPEFLRHLGLTDMRTLPEYERFHADEQIAKLLAESTGAPVGDEPATS